MQRFANENEAYRQLDVRGLVATELQNNYAAELALTHAKRMDYYKTSQRVEKDIKQDATLPRLDSAMAGDSDLGKNVMGTYDKQAKEWVYNNANTFGAKYLKHMAATDFGGWLGTAQRTDRAKIADVPFFLRQYVETTGDYAAMTAFNEAASLGLDFDGSEDWGTRGSFVYEGVQRLFNWFETNYSGIGFSENFSLFGPDEGGPTVMKGPDGSNIIVPRSSSDDATVRKANYSMRGMTPGSPLYNLVHMTDSSFTEDKRKAWADAMFDEMNPIQAEMYQKAGISREDIMTAPSATAAAMRIAYKQDAYHAAGYAANASGWATTGYFLQNMGATIINDPDMQAELAIGVATGGVGLMGRGVTWVGNGMMKFGVASKAAETAVATNRAARLSKTLARYTKYDKVAPSVSAGVRYVGIGVGKAGEGVQYAASVSRNLNPFQVGERIMLRSVRAVRTMRADFAGANGFKEARKAAEGLKRARLGFAGMAAREVLLGHSDVGFGAAIAANMIDGAFGNFMAYATTRDEEWLWQKALLGDGADWDHIKFQMYNPDNHMHSGLGAIGMGATFGAVIGGLIKGVGIVAFDPKGIKTKSEGSVDDIPLVKDFFKTLKMVSDYKNKLHLGEVRRSMYNTSVAYSQGQINLAYGKVQAGLIAAGVTSKQAHTRAKEMIAAAVQEGVNLQRVLKKAFVKTKVGGALEISYASLRDAIAEDRGTKAAALRRMALRRGYADANTEQMDINAAYAFNRYRMEFFAEERTPDGDNYDWAKTSHAEVLDWAIKQAENEGRTAIANSLKQFRENINIFSGEFKALLTKELKAFGPHFHSLPTAQKVAVIKEFLKKHGFDDVNVEDAMIEKVLGGATDSVIRARNAQQMAEARARYDKRISEREAADKAAEARRPGVDELEERYGVDGETRVESDEEAFAGMAGPEGTNTYAAKTTRELKAELKERGIPGRSKLTTKEKMVAALLADDAKKTEAAPEPEAPVTREPEAPAAKEPEATVPSPADREVLADTSPEFITELVARLEDPDNYYPTATWGRSMTNAQIEKVLEREGLDYNVRMVLGEVRNSRLRGESSEPKPTETTVRKVEEFEALDAERRRTQAEVEEAEKAHEDALEGAKDVYNPERGTYTHPSSAAKLLPEETGAKVKEARVRAAEARFAAGKWTQENGIPLNGRAFAEEVSRVETAAQKQLDDGPEGPDPAARTEEEAPAPRSEEEAAPAPRSEEEAAPAPREEEPTQTQAEFSWTAPSREDSAVEILVDAIADGTESNGNGFTSNVARNSIDHMDQSAARLNASNEGLYNLTQSMDHASLKALISMTSAADARVGGAYFRPADMARILRERVEKLEAAVARLKTSGDAVVTTDKNREARIKKLKEMTAADLKRELKKAHGIDHNQLEPGLFSDPTPGAKKVKAKAGSTKKIYLDLVMDLDRIKHLDSQLEAAGVKLPDLDMHTRIALGDPEASKELAREWLSLLRDADANVRTDRDLIPIEAIHGQYTPRGFEGMLETVFADAFIVSGRDIYLNIRDAITIAEGRYAMADSEYRTKLLADRKARMDEIAADSVEARVFGEVEAFNNKTLLTESFLRSRAKAHKDSIDHVARVNARRGAEDLDDYLARQEREFIRGVVEAWNNLPRGPVRDQLAKRYGIEEFSRERKYTDPRLNRPGSDALEEVMPVRRDAAAKIWRALHDVTEADSGVNRPGPEVLWNGQVDSVTGYVAGRALVEAASGQTTSRAQAAQARGVADVNVEAEAGKQMPTGGYLGRLNNEHFAKLYQQHVRESVLDFALRIGDEVEVDGRTLRRMSAEDIESILTDLDDISKRLKALRDNEEIPEDILARLNPVQYEAASKSGFAPKTVIRDLTAQIQSFRKQFESDVEEIIDAPPGIINMLHDEANVNQSWVATRFILGNVDEAGARIMDESKVVGDAGLNSATTVPGSFKDLWNLRTGQTFGTADGMSSAAALLGLNNVRGELIRNKSGIVEMDEMTKQDMERTFNLHNAQDASAQAPTIARHFYLDWIDDMKKRGNQDRLKASELTSDKNQKDFMKFALAARDALLENGGFNAAQKAAKQWFDNELLDPNNVKFDKYSAAGLEGLRQLKKKSSSHKIWGQLFDMLDGVDGDDVRLAGNKALGKWMRQELFKPPVMTISYGAGLRAFTGNTSRALRDLADNYEKYGITAKQAEDVKDALTKMAPTQFAETMLGKYGKPGAIQKALNIPSNEDLISMSRDRRLKVGDREFTRDEILSGDILANQELQPQLREHFLDKSDQVFGIKSPELGLWLLRLETIDPKRRNRAIEKMRGLVYKASVLAAKYPETDFAKHLDSLYTPSVAYTNSLRSANRLGFHLDSENARMVMEELGIGPADLTPAAREMLENNAPMFQNTGGAAGRKFGVFDGSLIIRNKNIETTAKEAGAVADAPGANSNIGQSTLAQTLSDIGGNALDGADLKLRVQNALMRDLLTEVGSVVLPKDPRTGEAMPKPSMSQFYRSAYELQGDGRSIPSRTRSERAANVDQRIKELTEEVNRLKDDPSAEANVSTLNKQIAILKELKKTVYGRDENGNVRFSSGQGLLSANMNARAQMNPDAGDDMPSQMGVPYLQSLGYSITNRELRHRRAMQRSLSESFQQGNTYSAGEALSPSSFAPAYLESVRGSNSGMSRQDYSDDDLATQPSFERSDASIKNEVDADAATGRELGLDGQGVRLLRLQSRIRERFARRMARAQHELYEMENAELHPKEDPIWLEADIADKKREIESIRNSSLKLLTEGYESTFGSRLNIEEPSVSNVKLPRGGRIRARRDSSPLKGLQKYARDNNAQELAGWLMGPSDRSGLDLRGIRERDADGNPERESYNILPYSKARGPMAVFSTDWLLMGGTAMQLPAMMVTRLVMAANPGKLITKEMYTAMARKVNEQGLEKNLAELIDNEYGGLKTVDDMEKFYRDSERVKQLLDDGTYDRYADADDLIDVTQAIDDELGVNMPAFQRIGMGESIVFKSVRDELAANPASMKMLQRLTGQDDLTPEMVAIQMSLTRAQMADLMIHGGTPIVREVDGKSYTVNGENLIFMPRMREDGDGRLTIDTEDITNINGRDITDENVSPGSASVLTYTQMLHSMNMPANREVVTAILLANRLGLDIDMNARLDNRINEVTDRFANPESIHGFGRVPEDEATAGRIREVAEKTNPLEQTGRRLDRVLGDDKTLRRQLQTAQEQKPKSRQSEGPHIGMALGEMIFHGHLLNPDGTLSRQGEDLVKKRAGGDDATVLEAEATAAALQRQAVRQREMDIIPELEEPMYVRGEQEMAESAQRGDLYKPSDEEIAAANRAVDEAMMEEENPNAMYDIHDPRDLGEPSAEVSVPPGTRPMNTMDEAPAKPSRPRDENLSSEPPKKMQTAHKLAQALTEERAENGDFPAGVKIRYTDFGPDDKAGAYFKVDADEGPMIVFNTRKFDEDKDPVKGYEWRLAHESGHMADLHAKGVEGYKAQTKQQREDAANEYAFRLFSEEGLALPFELEAYVRQDGAENKQVLDIGKRHGYFEGRRNMSEAQRFIQSQKQIAEETSAPAPLIDSADKAVQADRILGDYFYNKLSSTKTDDAQNAAKVFGEITGRGEGKSPTGVNDLDAMVLMEMAYIDPFVRELLWSGTMDVSMDGPLSVTTSLTPGKTLTTKLRGLDKIQKKLKKGKVHAAAYLLLHELVERADVMSLMRQRDYAGVNGPVKTDNKGNPVSAPKFKNPMGNRAGQAASQINKFYQIHFGNASGRKKFAMMMEEMDLLTPEISKFLKAAEALSRQVGSEDVKVYETKRESPFNEANRELRALEGRRTDKTQGYARERDQDAIDIVNEGFTQVLTLALFTRQSQQEGILTRMIDEIEVTVEEGANLSAGLRKVGSLISDKVLSMVEILKKHGSNPDTIRAGARVQDAQYGFMARNDVGETSMSKMLDTIATLAENGHANGAAFHYNSPTQTRYFGGGAESLDAELRGRDQIQEELNAVELEIDASSKASRLDQAQLRLQQARLQKELGILNAHDRGPDAAAENDFKVRVAAATDKKTGLINLRKLNPEDAKRVEDEAVDDMLANFGTQQSSVVGQAVNVGAGLFSAGRGLAAAANAKDERLRGLGAMINPEMVNTKVVGDRVWMSDAVAMDAQSRDYRMAIDGLAPFRKRSNKRKYKGEARREHVRAVSNALEMESEANRMKALMAAGYSEKQAKVMSDWAENMFDPESGMVPRLAEMMRRTGKISDTQAEAIKGTRELPRMLVRELVEEPGAADMIRGELAKIGQKHLLNQLEAGRIDVEAADGLGIFMNSANTARGREAEFEAMPESLRKFYLEAFKAYKDDLVDGRHVDDIPDFEKAFMASERYKLDLSRPEASRSKGFLSVKGVAFGEHYKAQLEANEPLPGTFTRDGSGAEKETRVQTKAKVMNEGSRDQHNPTSVLDMMAHRELVDLKTGGKLGDSRFIGSRKLAFETDSTGILKSFEDPDPMNRLTSLIGSGSTYDYATSVQQYGLGVQGMGTTQVLANVRRRVEKGEFGLSPVEKADAIKRLDNLEDQLRAGYNQRPKTVDSDPGKGSRFLLAFSRLGVSSLSAGNFALSAFVEVFGGVARSMGNLLRGDLMVFADYFRYMSSKQRARILENANGFELSKIHMGINTRLGDLGFDDLESMRNIENGDWISKFEAGSRKAASFAMTGFGKITEYSRAVTVAQAVRATKRVNEGQAGGYRKLAQLVGENFPKDLKEAKALARQAGIPADVAAHLYQNGHFSGGGELLQTMGRILGDEKAFTNQGLDIKYIRQTMKDAQQVDEGGIRHLDEAIGAIQGQMQFMNGKLNLDPRMGNRQIPRNIVEQLLSVLGQFPILFYSRMRQASYQAGALGVIGFLLPMLLGETYYTTLQQMTTGEKPEKVLERWTTDPLGALTNVLENMNVLGGMSSVIQLAMGAGMQNLRAMTGNPDMMPGYKAVHFQKTMVNAAGIDMAWGGAAKLFGAADDFQTGNVLRGLQRLTAAVPLPAQQVVKMALLADMDGTPEGQALSQGIGSSPNAGMSSLRPRTEAPADPVTLGTSAPAVPQEALTAPSAANPASGAKKPGPADPSSDPLGGMRGPSEDLADLL